MQELLTKRRLIVGTVIVLFVLSLNLFSSQARGFFTSFSAAPQAMLWDAGDSISNFFGGGDLQRQIEDLEEQNFLLRGQIVNLQSLRDENEDFRQILDLGIDEDFRILMGRIIGKNITEDTIRLRIGEKEGIQKGMPVITPGRVIIGRVTEVLADTSRVQLISNRKSSFGARIVEKEITGVMRGEGAQKMFIELVPQEDDLAIGDMVITSALGDIFPEGLLVGEVTEVVRTAAEPFQKARVQPLFNLKSLDTVFIISSLE